MSKLIMYVKFFDKIVNLYYNILNILYYSHCRRMLTEGSNSWEQVFLCMIRVHHKNTASTNYCRRFFMKKFIKGG